MPACTVQRGVSMSSTTRTKYLCFTGKSSQMMVPLQASRNSWSSSTTKPEPQLRRKRSRKGEILDLNPLSQRKMERTARNRMLLTSLTASLMVHQRRHRMTETETRRMAHRTLIRRVVGNLRVEYPLRPEKLQL